MRFVGTNLTTKFSRIEPNVLGLNSNLAPASFDGIGAESVVPAAAGEIKAT
jgi:hypothetical protein